MNVDLANSTQLAGIKIPDSKLASEITELVRETETPLLFHHSSRVYYWGALTGKRRGLRFDPELLYAGAMFHDWASPLSTPAQISASRWIARTRLVTFCGDMASTRKTSRHSGRQSH